MRLLRLAKAAIERCDLDLGGASVLTEAATGAYVVTPVIAAMAGAERVFAVTRTTRHGTAEEACEETLCLARLAGVDSKITVVHEQRPEIVGRADIVTNSGHVRPIDAEMVRQMKCTAVVPLMYEAWEYRAEDVDLAACRKHHVAVAGTNERFPSVDVFSYLGIMAVKLLLDAGIPVHGSHLVLLCDNSFLPYIREGLERAGATVRAGTAPLDFVGSDPPDAVLIALQPRGTAVLGEREIEAICDTWPGTVVVQYWGDIDRDALASRGVPYWPPTSPGPGHMGVLPSAVGPDAIVRLQTGGLKVGEILWRARLSGLSAEAAVEAAVRAGYGQAIQTRSEEADR